LMSLSYLVIPRKSSPGGRATSLSPGPAGWSRPGAGCLADLLHGVVLGALGADLPALTGVGLMGESESLPEALRRGLRAVSDGHADDEPVHALTCVGVDLGDVDSVLGERGGGHGSLPGSGSLPASL